MSVFSAFVISLINSGPVFEGYREKKKPLAMGISAFNCHEIHWQYTCSQAWWCNPVIPTLRRQRQERMFRPYLSYTVRQCFKTHNNNKSGFATNVKLCILSLSSLLLLYKEGRQAPESKQQPHKSQGVAQVSWGKPKKRKTKKAVCYLSDVHKGKDPGGPECL